MREVVGGSAQDAEEFIEPMAVWPELRFPPEMPFADEGSVVSIVFQERGDRRLVRRQSLVVIARVQRFVQPDFEALRIPPGDEGAPRRCTDWRRRIGARELQSLAGERVEHRCLIVRTAIATEVAVSKIVGEDEQHVRPGRLRRHADPCAGDQGASGGGGRDELATSDPRRHETSGSSAAMIRRPRRGERC